MGLRDSIRLRTWVGPCCVLAVSLGAGRAEASAVPEPARLHRRAVEPVPPTASPCPADPSSPTARAVCVRIHGGNVPEARRRLLALGGLSLAGVGVVALSTQSATAEPSALDDDDPSTMGEAVSGRTAPGASSGVRRSSARARTVMGSTAVLAGAVLAAVGFDMPEWLLCGFVDVRVARDSARLRLVWRW